MDNYRLFFIALLIQFYFTTISVANDKITSSVWKAGVSRIKITPEEPMWMAGYASRNHEGDGIITDLWAKALVIEDTNKNKALLITTDLESFPKSLSDRIRNRVEKVYGFTRAQIILNSSHTHSGPLLQGMYNCYTEDSMELKKAEVYSLKLEQRIIDLVGKTLKSMQSVRLYSGNGISRFQVNRRNNSESKLNPLTELKGPNDYSVPIIRITDLKGKPLAIVFGYACHNTTLDGYQWCGDYAGFAQIELEKLYPGITAMFFQGAGADQNPLPRSSVSLARQYGRELSASVEGIMNEKMHELAPDLKTMYKEIPLEFSSPPSKEVLINMVNKSSGYIKRWARELLNKIQKGETIQSTYPYPVQLWKIGDQLVFSFGGEVVIQYSLGIKKLFGNDVFVMGYCNDVMAYIPSDQILKEGGYEGDTSMIAFGLPAPWKDNVETLIMTEIIRLAEKININRIKLEN